MTTIFILKKLTGKYYIILLLSIFLSSCAGSNPEKNLSKPWYVEKNKVIPADKYNSSYIMVYLDINKPEKNNKKNIVKKFGNNIEKYGYVINYKGMSQLEKKKLFSIYQVKVNKNFEYYESPFVIFMKKQGVNLNPYKIISIKNISNLCLKEMFLRIENKIHKNESIEDLMGVGDEISKSWCKVKEESKKITSNENAETLLMSIVEILAKIK